MASLTSAAGNTTGENAELLPRTIGKFRQIGKTRVATTAADSQVVHPESAGALVSSQVAEYAGGNGARATIELFRFRQDADAYELLSLLLLQARQTNPSLELNTGIGTAGFVTDGEITFFKGLHLARIKALNGSSPNLEAFSQSLSDSLDKGEGDIPVLLKHLPDADGAFKNAVYLNSFFDLTRLPLQHAVLSSVESGGNADAALATYGSSRLLIVEFNTPQLASENDKRIVARIQELWKLGQPAPTAYRRVGNYSVFVFDAPDEQTAKRLIDEVKYEQVVQWLGENPNIFKEAERRYINTTLGVLVAVLKASGFALITCLGLGGLVGALLFNYRRAQQRAMAFSDAGGMLRLNLDDLTVAQTDPARLLRDRN